jgi:hypothetical protein
MTIEECRMKEFCGLKSTSAATSTIRHSSIDILHSIGVFRMQHRNFVASVLLGEIHGFVGSLNKAGQLFLLLVFSQADADCDLNILSVFR